MFAEPVEKKFKVCFLKQSSLLSWKVPSSTSSAMGELFKASWQMKIHRLNNSSPFEVSNFCYTLFRSNKKSNHYPHPLPSPHKTHTHRFTHEMSEISSKIYSLIRFETFTQFLHTNFYWTKSNIKNFRDKIGNKEDLEYFKKPTHPPTEPNKIPKPWNDEPNLKTFSVTPTHFTPPIFKTAKRTQSTVYDFKQGFVTSECHDYSLRLINNKNNHHNKALVQRISLPFSELTVRWQTKDYDRSLQVQNMKG